MYGWPVVAFAHKPCDSLQCSHPDLLGRLLLIANADCANGAVMKLRLYDTYTRTLREFAPLAPPQVSLYACGLTVYDYAHIGNLRTYIFEDILRRTLEFNGYSVNHIMNITDVGHLVSDADSGEDKMEKGSRRTGKSAWEIAEFYTEVFKEDLN